MKAKVYTIVFQESKAIQKFTCSCYSLDKNIRQFSSEGKKILEIIPHEIPSTIKKPKDQNEIQKQRAYNNKYSNCYNKYKKGKMSETEFKIIKNFLKQLKDECTTRTEFEKKFSNYMNKKSTNNIRQYSVSD